MPMTPGNLSAFADIHESDRVGQLYAVSCRSAKTRDGRQVPVPTNSPTEPRTISRTAQ